MDLIKQLFCAVLFFSMVNSYAQEKLQTYQNGLIYSERAMNNLCSIADSLHVDFLSCDFDKEFFAAHQALGKKVNINGKHVIKAKKAMEEHMNIHTFMKLFPEASITNDILILKEKYTNYNDEQVVEFRHFDLKDGDGFKIISKDPSIYHENYKGKWIFRYYPASTYSKEESITGFYFPVDFESKKIPHKYAEMIGYADCMIDTTTSKFKQNTTNFYMTLPKNWVSFNNTEKLQLLDSLRSTKVVGSCSMDNSPRQHAQHIAMVAAETIQWNIFLKAHLDIMNDRFERITDGSYAYEGRKTYIKELEELALDNKKLLLGTVFRIENPAENHYFGDINRLGRSIAESSYKDDFEEMILSIINDEELDDYNRILFYFLFLNYNYHLSEDNRIEANKVRVTTSLENLTEAYRKELVHHDK